MSRPCSSQQDGAGFQLRRRGASALGRAGLNIEGYEDFTVKKIKRTQAYVDMDIRLLPDESKQPTVVKYVLNDDPYNTLVIKF